MVAPENEKQTSTQEMGSAKETMVSLREEKISALRQLDEYRGSEPYWWVQLSSGLGYTYSERDPFGC